MYIFQNNPLCTKFHPKVTLTHERTFHGFRNHCIDIGRTRYENEINQYSYIFIHICWFYFHIDHLNALRTGDADLRFYIITLQDG